MLQRDSVERVTVDSALKSTPLRHLSFSLGPHLLLFVLNCPNSLKLVNLFFSLCIVKVTSAVVLLEFSATLVCFLLPRGKCACMYCITSTAAAPALPPSWQTSAVIATASCFSEWSSLLFAFYGTHCPRGVLSWAFRGHGDIYAL